MSILLETLTDGSWHYLDHFLFAVLPYLAMAVFFIVSIQRYRAQSFTYSSLSSQFLENRRHFLASVPFHYGILVVLAGHVVAFLIPRSILLWNRHPLRLYILEGSALVFALLALTGFCLAVYRRLTVRKVRRVTTVWDWILFCMLLFQLVTGIYVACFHGWGSSWFAAALSPYLWSLVKFNPDLSYVVGLPLMVKLHIVSAFLLIAYFPFTRLVHILVIPNMYLWRRTQVVRWYADRASRVPRR